VRDFAEGSARAKKEGFHIAGAQKTGYNRLTGGINLEATAENEEGVRLTSIVLGGKDSDRRYAANLRNLRNGFAEVNNNPQYATVYRSQPDVTLVAAASPSSAFADAAKPRAGGRQRRPEVVQVANAEDSRPRSRFNKTGSRPQVMPAALREPVSLRTDMRIDTATLQTALSVMPSISADGAAGLSQALYVAPGIAPAEAPPSPAEQVKEQGSGLTAAERLGLRRPGASAQPD